mmetsp:Transcript_1220/g.3766  ORF Transcript_1220/g.3766 Transcript_1220/m.3766 type:complete len:96 (+) Transcript_1220:1226-1513(+)
MLLVCSQTSAHMVILWTLWASSLTENLQLMHFGRLLIDFRNVRSPTLPAKPRPVITGRESNEDLYKECMQNISAGVVFFNYLICFTNVLLIISVY